MVRDGRLPSVTFLTLSVLGSPLVEILFQPLTMIRFIHTGLRTIRFMIAGRLELSVLKATHRRLLNTIVFTTLTSAKTLSVMMSVRSTFRQRLGLRFYATAFMIACAEFGLVARLKIPKFHGMCSTTIHCHFTPEVLPDKDIVIETRRIVRSTFWRILLIKAVVVRIIFSNIRIA